MKRTKLLRRMIAWLLSAMLLASLTGSLAAQEDDEDTAVPWYATTEDENPIPEQDNSNLLDGTLGATTGVIPNKNGTLGATTGIITNDEGEPLRDSDVYIVKGGSLFTEYNHGAHYYVFSPYTSTYQEAFANIKLPTSFNNAYNTRNGCIALGIYGSQRGIDMGLKNTGNGWFPAIYDVYYAENHLYEDAEHLYPEYTAPSTATNAIITVNPVSTTSVRMYVQFKDSSGYNVGTTFDQTISIEPGNLVTDNYGNVICRFYRFASLIPKDGVIDNREDSSYMLGGQFINVSLYHRTYQSYQTWGISTDRVSHAWIMYPSRCWISYTTTNDSFTIDHWSST